MAEKRKLEFFLLRYVPDVVKGEFVNFGLVTLADGENGAELVDVRFTRDRSRLLCLDPQLDLEVLDKLQAEIRGEMGLVRDKAMLLKRMEDSFSGVVQLSQAMPALTEKTAAEEIESVARIFLEVSRQKRMREPTGRQRILETMRSEFEKAGVLGLVSPVPAEPYSKPGDPFTFDFGYRVASEIKLFHAVTMRASVDAAVLLAARYSKLAPEMARVTASAPSLTAVVDAELDRTRREVGFAIEMMEENRITVAGVGEMPRIAEMARRELRA